MHTDLRFLNCLDLSVEELTLMNTHRGTSHGDAVEPTGITDQPLSKYTEG